MRIELGKQKIYSTLAITWQMLISVNVVSLSTCKQQRFFQGGKQGGGKPQGLLKLPGGGGKQWVSANQDEVNWRRGWLGGLVLVFVDEEQDVTETDF